MEKTKILIIEDEWKMRNLIKVHLSARGEYEWFEAADGKDALELFRAHTFDLVILDIMLPGMDGWEICRNIRSFSAVPILMLTARSEVQDRVKGLQMGADDYLIKPFAPEELMARITALLRRSKAKEAQMTEIRIKELVISLEAREVKVNGQTVELTPKEYSLLLLLAQHPKNVFTRDHLLDILWENGEDRDLRTVDTHVKNLRVKLKRARLSFNPIKTVWGVGYRLGDADV